MDTKNIDALVKEAGGYQAVADEFGISWQAVQLWCRSRVPAERVKRFAKLTGATPESIRPDVFGDL